MEIVGWFTINQILKVSQVSGDFTQFKWIQDSCFLHNVQLTSSLGRGWILLPFPSAFDWRLGIIIHTYIHTTVNRDRMSHKNRVTNMNHYINK